MIAEYIDNMRLCDKSCGEPAVQDGQRVVFEGFIIGYEEPNMEISKDEYSILVDGELRDEEGSIVHEGYFYLVAPRSMEGKIDMGVGSNISGVGKVIMGGGEPVLRLLKTL